MHKFENFESWMKEKWGNQSSLAQELGVNQNTVSSWKTGRSRIHPDFQAKLRALGYDGPFPEGHQELTQDDLQALGRDLVRLMNHAHEDLKRDIQAVGAMLQELLRRTEHLK